MVKLLLWTLAFLLALINTGEGKTLMCVRCNSKNDHYKGECQNDPPPPSRCSGGSTEQYCIIAKEYAKNGTLIGFVRDCSASVTDNSETCREPISDNPKSPAKVCVTSCGKPGCNSAVRDAPAATILFLGLLVYSLVLD